MSGEDPTRGGYGQRPEDEQIEEHEENTMKKPFDSAHGGEQAGGALARVRAADVLGPRGIVQIEHDGEIYTLRLTRNNRLILTK